MQINNTEAAALVKYLGQMDKEHGGIPSAIQEIAEKLEYALGDKVIFRKWSKTRGGGIIAFLPDEEANWGMISSYEHIGQHAEASVEIMARPYTTIAKPHEYAELLAELKSIGYNPKVYKRLQYGWLNWQGGKERFNG